MDPTASLITHHGSLTPAAPERGPDIDVAQLGEAIAALAVRLHAATYELLVLLREFDACAGWSHGFLSCAHWLHWRTGIDLGAAREKVRVARSLAALPLISRAMQRGELSYAKVRALTRVATAENEPRLLDVARAGTAAHVERLVRAWRRTDRVEAHHQAERRHQQRQLVTWVDDDGMLVIRGRLAPEAGAVVQRALEAAADQLFHESAGAPTANTVAGEVTPAQRRADALAQLAECALAGGLDRGTTGDRYQVVVHVEPAALQGEAPRPSADAGHAVVELDGGPVNVSAETSRRLACDAALVVMRHGGDYDPGGSVSGPAGSVLDVSRRTRTIPAAIRRALAARDRHCRFPGCTARRCDAHHIRHWSDGGPTSLANVVFLCRRHHRAVHEEGFRVVRTADGAIAFFTPDDAPLAVAPALSQPASLGASPSGPSEWKSHDVVVGPSALSVWDGTPFDVVWAVDTLRTGPGPL
jgi:hypothetical protein